MPTSSLPNPVRPIAPSESVSEKSMPILDPLFSAFMIGFPVESSELLIM